MLVLLLVLWEVEVPLDTEDMGRPRYNRRNSFTGKGFMER